jgi:CP family cyanate transporter-like MFS transporter
MTGAAPERAGTPFRRAVFIGLLLFAFVLRGPFVVVSTVTGELNSELGMSAAVIGLLTSLPVLCFGLAAPAASALIGRLGVERSILVTLFGVLVGVLIRSVGGIPGALLGTLILGLAITVGNVVSPVLIGRDFRGRIASVTGSYTAALNVGTMITLSATGPLVGAFGWQIALAVWVVLPLLAAVVWIPLARQAAAKRSREPAVATGGAPQPNSRGGSDAGPPAAGGKPAAESARLSTVLRRPTTWMLTFAFAGQAFSYYGLTAWLPTLLAEEQGMTRVQSGAASSIFQICAVIGAFATPVLINRTGTPLWAFVVNGLLWSALPLGLLFAPDLWAVWSASSGTAQGGGFVAVFTVVVLRAKTLRENRQLSAIVQTGGYCVAALGPIVVGGLHESTGSWTAPLLTVVAAICCLTILGAMSARGLQR